MNAPLIHHTNLWNSDHLRQLQNFVFLLLRHIPPSAGEMLCLVLAKLQQMNLVLEVHVHHSELAAPHDLEFVIKQGKPFLPKQTN